MKTRSFRDFIVFSIDSADTKHIYIEFISEKANIIDLNTNEEAQELLDELFKLLDPIILLCNLEMRSFIITVDMNNANILRYKINILKYIIEKLHEHIKTDRKDLTEKCYIKNADIVLKSIYFIVSPFIDKTFMDKIHIE